MLRSSHGEVGVGFSLNALDPKRPIREANIAGGPSRARIGSHKALKRGEVPQCLNSGKEKICAALDCREGRQTGYLFADRTFGDREIETAVLVADERVSFVAEFVKIRVIDPDILRELKLPHEACTKNERCNATINAIFRRAFGQRRTIGRATANHSSPLHVRRRIARIHAPNMCSKRNGIALRVHFRVVEIVVALVISAKCWIVLVGRQNERSSAPPASHQLRRDQFLAFGCWSTMLAQEVAERRRHAPAICDRP